MESSFRSLTPFFAIILQLPIPKTRLHSIPLLPSSYPGRLESRNSTLHSTRLHSMLLLPASELFLITTLHGPRRKHSLYIVGNVCLQRRRIATIVILLLLVYSLPQECVYRVVAYQWTSILTSLFQLSGVMSQYIFLQYRHTGINIWLKLIRKMRYKHANKNCNHFVQRCSF
jgi:hypothetical protein